MRLLEHPSLQWMQLSPLPAHSKCIPMPKCHFLRLYRVESDNSPEGDSQACRSKTQSAFLERFQWSSVRSLWFSRHHLFENKWLPLTFPPGRWIGIITIPRFQVTMDFPKSMDKVKAFRDIPITRHPSIKWFISLSKYGLSRGNELGRAPGMNLWSPSHCLSSYWGRNSTVVITCAIPSELSIFDIIDRGRFMYICNKNTSYLVIFLRTYFITRILQLKGFRPLRHITADWSSKDLHCDWLYRFEIKQKVFGYNFTEVASFPSWWGFHYSTLIWSLDAGLQQVIGPAWYHPDLLPPHSKPNHILLFRDSPGEIRQMSTWQSAASVQSLTQI